MEGDNGHEVRLQPQELGDELLQGVKLRARFFYQWYLGARLINKEIARFARRKAEHERGEIDWDVLPEHEGVLGIERSSQPALETNSETDSESQ